MMSLLSYFRAQRRQRTASVAKERLQILVAHERAARNGLDWLPSLQEELLTVIKKYVEIDRDAIQIELEREGDCDILELNITLPER
jgi:cell division topological specificity factor